MLTEKTFDTGELTLNYAEEVTAGAPLVLLHGAVSRWRGWMPLLPKLTTDWHPYAFDLRGHGKSGRDADHYHLNDYARDIVAFLRSEMNEPVTLMGHSLGAFTAIAVAAQAQEKVRALLLLDPPLFIRNGTVSLIPEVEKWFKFVYEATTTIHTDAEMLAKVREIAQPNDTEADLVDLAQTLRGVAPEVTKIIIDDQLIDGFNPEQALKKISCPTVLVVGDWDKGAAMRDEDVEFVRDCIPGVHIVKIPGAGHAIPDQHPDIVLRELRRLAVAE